MSITRISLIVLGFIAIVAYFTLFTVLEVKNAIVLQFGDPKKIISKGISAGFSQNSYRGQVKIMKRAANKINPKSIIDSTEYI